MKMDERDLKDHVIQLHNGQKARKETFEEGLAVRKVVDKAQAEVVTKVVDDNIVNEVIIYLTNSGVMDEGPDVSKETQADEVISQQKELASKKSETSHEATSRENDVLDAVIVYSTSSSPTLINYAPPNMVIRDQVQDIISQAMDTYVE